MSKLHIYPTSRSIRESISSFKNSDGFLPHLMRMDEFLERIVIIPDRYKAQMSQRIFWLREASEFDSFEDLGSRRELIRFFSHSEDFFRFFEELAWERVELKSLKEADAYAQYMDHLEILDKLLRGYIDILEREKAYDRIIIPKLYQINRSFLASIDEIELFLEGYLSRFELEILEKLAKDIELKIHWRTTPYNEKMRQRFIEVGIELPKESEVLFSLSQKRLLSKESIPLNIKAKVFGVGERLEQIAVAFVEIERMVQQGIAPEKIALILPDERFAHIFKLYDKMNNLNFSMGYDYLKTPYYLVPMVLLQWWQSFDPKLHKLLEHYSLDPDSYQSLNPSQRLTAKEFYLKLHRAKIPGFVSLESKETPPKELVPILELLHSFFSIHKDRRLMMREWLFIWLEEFKSLRLDDVRGGKVTVMGVLETRGVEFDGVVIVDFNEGIVPASSRKDRFLDTRVRHFASLPDRLDREALQKHYYARLIERAEDVVILYTNEDSKLPSKLLYELGLKSDKTIKAPREILYNHTPLKIDRDDPVVENFDPLSMNWSSSRLRVWLECRRRFYYRYILALEEKQSEEINEGQILHKVLEKLFIKQDYYDDIKAIQRVFETISAKELARYKSYGRYIQALWSHKMLPYFTQEIIHFSQGWRVEAREKSIEGEIEGLHFVGRVDRIDRREDELMVLDYKSGSLKEANRKSSLEMVSDFQMSIYQALLRGGVSKLELFFVNPLEEKPFVKAEALEQKSQYLKEHLKILKETSSFIATRCEDVKKCTYCPYQLLCERGEYL